MIDDEANKQHNLLDKKLSPTFDKYLSLIVYKVLHSTAPHQSSQLLSTRESRYLAAAGRRRRLSLRLNFGVSGKLRTSGETATEGVTCFAIDSHFHLLGSGLSEKATTPSTILVFQRSFFSQPDFEFSDTR